LGQPTHCRFPVRGHRELFFPLRPRCCSDATRTQTHTFDRSPCATALGCTCTRRGLPDRYISAPLRTRVFVRLFRSRATLVWFPCEWVEPGRYTSALFSNPDRYTSALFSNPGALFSNPGALFSNPGALFSNPGALFSNPGRYCARRAARQQWRLSPLPLTPLARRRPATLATLARRRPAPLAPGNPVGRSRARRARRSGARRTRRAPRARAARTRWLNEATTRSM